MSSTSTKSKGTNISDNMKPPVHREAGDTERAAAEAIAPHTATMREQVLEVITLGGSLGATPEEITEALGYDIRRLPSVRPRCTELRDDNKIVDSGMRRKVPGQTTASIVWVRA